VARLVDVFRELRRVLRPDGTLWLNLGDSYAAGLVGRGERKGTQEGTSRASADGTHHCHPGDDSLKPKDLIGIPWRCAFALQADGWYLRSDIIWSKPNPMPESVRDRPTRSHEYLFLLSRSARYFYDADAIAEPVVKLGTPGHLKGGSGRRAGTREGLRGRVVGMGKNYHLPANAAGRRMVENTQLRRNEGMPHDQAFGMTRNRRTVWTITPMPFKGAHFATFPEKLVEPCILAGSRPGDVVLDPFSGAGTTVIVAERLGRTGIGIELSPEYVRLSETRLAA
jgi:DNA modification methylase